MPYGLPKDMDTPENNAKMERCVSRLSHQKDKNGNIYGKDKAVAICKYSIMRSKSEASLDFFIDLFIKELEK